VVVPAPERLDTLESVSNALLDHEWRVPASQLWRFEILVMAQFSDGRLNLESRLNRQRPLRRQEGVPAP
jgi:hypothetical protein